MFEYECALTGRTEDGIQPDDSDGLGDLPLGWTRVQITRRQINPKWMLIQQVKQSVIEGILQQFPEELREVQRYAVMVQIEAQFHGLESSTPRYLPDVDDVVYISADGTILDTVNEIREMLNLPAIRDADEADEEDESEEDADDGDEEEAESATPRQIAAAPKAG
jgi:hypothetical protein